MLRLHSLGKIPASYQGTPAEPGMEMPFEAASRVFILMRTEVEMGLTPCERAHRHGFVPGRVGRVQSRSSTGTGSPNEPRIFRRCSQSSTHAPGDQISKRYVE